MNARMALLLGSACLCVVFAVFANPLFDWTNRVTRKLGFNKLADFREGLRTPLMPIARIVLILTAIPIVVLTSRHPR